MFSQSGPEASLEVVARRAGAEFIATKTGMAAALAMAAHGSSELAADSLTG